MSGLANYERVYLTCTTKPHNKHYYIGIVPSSKSKDKYDVVTAHGSILSTVRNLTPHTGVTAAEAIKYVHAVVNEKYKKGYKTSVPDLAAVSYPVWWSDYGYKVSETKVKSSMVRKDADWNF